MSRNKTKEIAFTSSLFCVSYELKRGPDWTELINPAEVFRDIMVDYSYVECTSACVQALVSFRHVFPFHRTEEVDRAIAGGARFIRSVQKEDGSWLGKWAVCFTYGTWFGVEGLVAAGELPATSEGLKKAREWLLSVQNPNGSWGEDFQSCVQVRRKEENGGGGDCSFVIRHALFSLI